MKSVNTQGLSRSDKGLMSGIVAESNHTTISSDAISCEPTIISHYSGDENYKYASFDGIGKEAFYNERGMLMLDDIYLMVGSINPATENKIREAFETTYNGVSGYEQWSIDKSVIKSEIKDERVLSKTAVLGLGYGMGPKKLVTSCYDKGFIISMEDAKKVHKLFWHEAFPKLNTLRDFLSSKVKKEGHLINPFGFRLIPTPHKALNYFIQSTVNGVINVTLINFLEKFPEAKFRTIIHDEVIFDVPDDKIKQAKEQFYKSVQELNNLLNWSIDMRFGWVEGKDWYEAH